MSGYRGSTRIKYPWFPVAALGILWLLSIVAPTLSLAQNATAGPVFEVASVKLVERRQPGPARIDRGLARYPYTTLTYLIMQAYSVQSYQVDCPDWLNTVRYEVIGKIPDGHGPEQVPVMLQNLLHERFRLEVHREARNQPVYVLMVGPNGPRLKKTDRPASPNDAAKGRFTISSTGRLVLYGSTLAQLAEMLSSSFGEPVLDKTGIEGEFDMELNLGSSQLRGLRVTADGTAVPEEDQGMSPGLQMQLRALGLKLVTQKALIEHLRVDHVERIPTPN